VKDFLNGFIDPKRIIDGKKSRIQKDYEQLCENYNVTNSIEFLTKIRNYPLSEILENSYYIHKEPRGTDFLNYVLKTNDLKQEDIQLQMITVNKTLQNNNLSNSHISKLNECLNILKEKEKKINDINYIKESIKYDLITSSISRPLLESPVINDLDIIIQNINYQPEIIEKYEEMIQEIKKWKAKTILTNFVPLLVKNTVLIAGITVLLVGSALTLIVSLPLLLVSKLIEERIDKRYISTFVYVISKEIKKVEELIQMSDIKKKKMLEEYAYSLKSARERLMKYDIYAKKFKGVRESHIGQMQPNPYHDTIAEMEKEIDDLIEEANSELEWKPVVEAVNPITIKPSLENAIYIKICDFIFDEREDCLESFKKITDLVTKYEQLIILEEGADESRKSLSRKVALKAEVAAKKSIKKLRDMKTKGQHTTAVLKRVPRHIEDFINNTLNKLKEMDRTERRNRIIEGTVRKKLMKVVRDAIVLGVTWAINPALTAITLIAGVAIDKKTDRKVRHQILHELELELKIVDEKIEDARSDGSRRKKYELMRIKHKLEREIDRIRYNLGA